MRGRYPCCQTLESLGCHDELKAACATLEHYASPVPFSSIFEAGPEPSAWYTCSSLLCAIASQLLVQKSADDAAAAAAGAGPHTLPPQAEESAAAYGLASLSAMDVDEGPSTATLHADAHLESS